MKDLFKTKKAASQGQLFLFEFHLFIASVEPGDDLVVDEEGDTEPEGVEEEIYWVG